MLANSLEKVAGSLCNQCVNSFLFLLAVCRSDAMMRISIEYLKTVEAKVKLSEHSQRAGVAGIPAVSWRAEWVAEGKGKESS